MMKRMRSWWLAAAAIAVGCFGSANPPTDEPPISAPDRFDAAIDALPGNDASTEIAADDAAVDAGGDGGKGVPFAKHLVLRFETDAPDGLQTNGAWRDLSAGARNVTIAGGTPVTEPSD